LPILFFAISNTRLSGEPVSILSINISKLSEGAHQRSLQVAPQEIGLDSRFTKEVNVEAALESTSRQLYVHAEFKTGGVFTCDRCLEEFECDVSSGFDIVYVAESRAEVGEDEDMRVLSPDTNYIDLDEDVRQYAILALPQKTLCAEDCAGLCPICGTNLNRAKCDCRNEAVDSPLSGLQKFIKN